MRIKGTNNNLMPRKNRITFLISITVILSVILVFMAFRVFDNKLDHLLDMEARIYLDEINRQGIHTIKHEILDDIKLLKELAIITEIENTFEIDSWITAIQKKELLAEFDEIGIVLRNGQSYGQFLTQKDYSSSNEFKRAMRGETVVSQVLIDPINHNHIIKYLVPIVHKNQVVAVLVAVVHEEALQKVLDLQNFQGEGSTYIVDSAGKIIMHGENDRHYSSIFVNMDKPNENIDKMKQNLRLGKKGHLYYSEAGLEKQLAYDRIGINDWSLLVAVPDDLTLYKENTIEKLAVILSSVVMFVLTAFVGYILFEQHKHRKSLLNLAYMDEVTGAYNKNGFKQLASVLIKKQKSDYAFILLDISKFKIINDIFSYVQGDMLLKHIAQILSNNTKDNELFARIEGDKFYLLVEYFSEQDLETRIKKIMEEITAFQFTSDTLYRTVACAGIYIIEDLSMPIELMSDRANLANRKVKGSHYNAYFFYNDAVRHQLIEEQEIENEMQRALDNNEFKVYLQPKYDVKTERIAGAEALIRWQHPTKGLIPPDRFIPVFEKDGFVTKIDMFVLEEVCKKQKEWQEQGNRPRIISVNQSKLHLYNPKYVEEIFNITSKYQVNPNYIEFEITESAVFDNVGILLDVTSRIRQAGYKMSIDDFGTGYSSLNMLKDLALDTLKLDGEFFSETVNLKRSHKITENIIRMSKDLGMRVVAEGVETKEQVDFLREMGCDLIQGYYYAKPMPIDDFYQLLLNEETLATE